MSTVLQEFIHPDQACAIQGRKITDSLVLIRDTICYARDRNLRLIVLNLDFEKAFDRVSHQYLFQAREPVVRVRGLGEAESRRIWENAAHPALLNRHKDLSWLAAHEILPVRAVMHSRGMAKSSICPRPGCGAPETVRHALWECSAARDLWSATGTLWCPSLPAGAPSTLGYREAVNGVGWSRHVTPAVFSELWPTLNSIKDAIWVARNLLVGKRLELPIRGQIKLVEACQRNYAARRHSEEGAGTRS
ncbi:hypothetical protein MHYP_G00161390 [Metynnis hypsauchen]